jgi:Ulp1 family protease
VIATLKEYLNIEWSKRFAGKRVDNPVTSLEGSLVECPLQTNFFDCGIYLLQNVESFFTQPIEDYSLPIDKSNWFGSEVTGNKRQVIKSIILSLQEKRNNLAAMATAMITEHSFK